MTDRFRMNLLGLEFSAEQRSVAVRIAAAGKPDVLTEVIESGGRSTKAFSMIEEALCQAQIEREEIRRLAIGLGPGSYTGIRAAISMAQGWQLARDVALVGISSADCIAAQAQAEGMRGTVAVIIDAQRDELYLARYELEAQSWRQTTALKLIPAGEAMADLQTACAVAGPEAQRWFPQGKIIMPRAAMLVKLAAGRSDTIPGDKLEPIYLRETAFVKAPLPKTWSNPTATG